MVDLVHWLKVKLQTSFTGPNAAIHYFCVTAPRAESDAEDVADQRGRSKCQLIEDIKEQWAHERSQQEEMQKVLVNKADEYKTTNWLKRATWIAHFKERDLGE